jgi:hypothetical protein
MQTREAPASLFAELASYPQSDVDGVRGTATITETIESSDTDEAVTQLLLSYVGPR